MSGNESKSSQLKQAASLPEVNNAAASTSFDTLYPHITRLHQSIGNWGVGRLLQASRRKPEIEPATLDNTLDLKADHADTELRRAASSGDRPDSASEDEVDAQLSRAAIPSAAVRELSRDARGSPPPREDDISQRIEAARAGGESLPAPTRADMESAFGADFSKVKIHSDSEAARLSMDIGARAFATGPDIFFGEHEFRPGTSSGRHLLAHELTHTIQQGASTPLHPSRRGVLNSPAANLSTSMSARRVQAAPKVTAAAAPAEIGAGGKTIRATATVAGGARVDWNLVGAPAGVSINPSTGVITATKAAAVAGGTKFQAQAKLKGTPADDAISGDILVVGVTAATFAPNPPFAAQPFGGGLQPFPAPDTVDPNRDGYGGNTAVTTVTTNPAGRPTTLSLRGGGAKAGSTAAENIITPGAATGVINVRAKDTATEAFFDATLNVDPVPVFLGKLAVAANFAPAAYGARHAMTFKSSDNTATPVTRLIGETVTFERDDFGILPGINAPGGPNPAPIPGLSAPANTAQDSNRTAINPAAAVPIPGVVPGQGPLDINNYVGPGVLVTLPRIMTARQGLHHLSWSGTQSAEFDKGIQRRSLIQIGAKFFFKTEQIFPHAAAPPTIDPYAGPNLISLSNILVTPKTPAAQAIAADGVATGEAAVATTVAGRNVNWLVVKGPIAFTIPAAGAALAVGAKAVIQAGLVAGTFPIQAQDSVFINRQTKGFAKIVPVTLTNIAAAPKNVPAGTLLTNITVNANPGGRTLLAPTVDPTSAAKGVTAANAAVAAAAAALPQRQVTVTRPAGFTGSVTVTLADTIRPAASASIKLKFL